MNVATEITRRGIETSSVLDELIQERVDKLSRYYPMLLSCRIALEQPHKSRRTGNHYKLRIEMTVPDDILVVSHENHDRSGPESMHVTVREAFERAERQLREFTERKKQRVKAHVVPSVGTVVDLDAGRRSGVIEAPDGRRFQFDERSFLGTDGSDLSVGNLVSFADPSDDRPNIARSVVVVPPDRI